MSGVLGKQSKISWRGFIITTHSKNNNEGKKTKNTRTYCCEKYNSSQNQFQINNKGKQMNYLAVPGISIPGMNNSANIAAKAKPEKKIGTTAVENTTK